MAAKTIIAIILIAGVTIPSVIFIPPLLAPQEPSSREQSLLSPPVLDTLLPTSDTGQIMLTWTHHPDTKKLNIYRATSSFTNIANATLIKTLQRAFPVSYTDKVGNGMYYYAMTAIDSTGAETKLSNLAWVSVTIPNALLGAPLLASLTSPSTTGLIDLSWSVANGSFIKCNVYRATSPFTSKVQATLVTTVIGSGPTRSMRDTITVNAIYYYAVTVFDTHDQESAISNVVSVSVQIPTASNIPDPPTVDTIPPTSSTGKIQLTWQVNPDIPQCKIYRSTTDFSTKAAATVIASPQGTGTSRTYTDTVTDGTYYYAVTAIAPGGVESVLSNKVYVSVTIITQPVAPSATVLTVTPTTSTDGKFYLSWTNVANANKFLVYRSSVFFTSTASATKIQEISAPTLTYIDTPVNGQYYYGIVVVGSTGLSSILSNVVSVVMQMPVAPQSQFARLDEGVTNYYQSIAIDPSALPKPSSGLSLYATIATQSSSRINISPATYTKMELFKITLTDTQLKTWLGVNFLSNTANRPILFYGLIAGTSQFSFIISARRSYLDTSGKMVIEENWYVALPAASETQKGLPNIYTVENSFSYWFPSNTATWTSRTLDYSLTGGLIRPILA